MNFQIFLIFLAVSFFISYFCYNPATVALMFICLFLHSCGTFSLIQIILALEKGSHSNLVFYKISRCCIWMLWSSSFLAVHSIIIFDKHMLWSYMITSWTLLVYKQSFLLFYTSTPIYVIMIFEVCTIGCIVILLMFWCSLVRIPLTFLNNIGKLSQFLLVDHYLTSLDTPVRSLHIVIAENWRLWCSLH